MGKIWAPPVWVNVESHITFRFYHLTTTAHMLSAAYDVMRESAPGIERVLARRTYGDAVVHAIEDLCKGWTPWDHSAAVVTVHKAASDVGGGLSGCSSTTLHRYWVYSNVLSAGTCIMMHVAGLSFKQVCARVIKPAYKAYVADWYKKNYPSADIGEHLPLVFEEQADRPRPQRAYVPILSDPRPYRPMTIVKQTDDLLRKLERRIENIENKPGSSIAKLREQAGAIMADIAALRERANAAELRVSKILSLVEDDNE